MRIYFAPLEGITTAGFRSIYADLFPGIDKYFTPFVGANQTLHFQRKEIRDILPQNNKGLNVVPQIMSNKANEFVWAVNEIAGYGYKEINLNLGCPMPQVAKRRKGSGFLADTDELDRFFDLSFNALENSDCRNISVSVKTRCGISSHDEADAIMDVYNRYPISELIIHPRTRDEKYSGIADRDTFEAMYVKSIIPVCYNGDIFTMDDYRSLHERFPKLECVMIGRGFLYDPLFSQEIIDGNNYAELTDHEKNSLICAYHDRIFQYYLETLQGEQQAVMKMKGIWWYLEKRFGGSEKLLKKVRKARDLETYQYAVDQILKR